MLRIIKSKINYPNLCFLYICLISFQHLLAFPIIGYKIQPSEIIFIGILILGLNLLWEQRGSLSANLQINILDIGLIVFFLSLLPSLISNWGLRPILEIIGLLYLFLVYLSFRVLQFFVGTEETIKLIAKGFLWASVIAIAHGVIGLVFTSLTGNDKLAEIYPNFPYLGDIIRMHGWAMSPNMLMSIFTVAYFLNRKLLTVKEKKVFYPILFLGIFLTFSKSWFLFIAVFLFIEASAKKSIIQKYFLRISSLAFIFIYLFLGHFYFQTGVESVIENNYRSNIPIYESTNLKIYSTTYVLLKKAALQIGSENFWTGTGLGNFSKEIEKLKSQNQFESHIPAYDPHSSYFGLYAEGGIFAIIGLLCLMGTLVFSIAKAPPSPIVYSMIGILLFISIEAFATDITNFRQYWIILVLIPYLRNLTRINTVAFYPLK